MLLSEGDYNALYEDLRPEIKSLLASDMAYWEAKYNENFGKVQDYLYDLYLKYNKVEAGRKSYSEVIGLIIAAE